MLNHFLFNYVVELVTVKLSITVETISQVVELVAGIFLFIYVTIFVSSSYLADFNEFNEL
jgi:hypothetical protein